MSATCNGYIDVCEWFRATETSRFTFGPPKLGSYVPIYYFSSMRLHSLQVYLSNAYTTFQLRVHTFLQLFLRTFVFSNKCICEGAPPSDTDMVLGIQAIVLNGFCLPITHTHTHTHNTKHTLAGSNADTYLPALLVITPQPAAIMTGCGKTGKGATIPLVCQKLAFGSHLSVNINLTQHCLTSDRNHALSLLSCLSLYLLIQLFESNVPVSLILNTFLFLSQAMYLHQLLACIDVLLRQCDSNCGSVSLQLLQVLITVQSLSVDPQLSDKV